MSKRDEALEYNRSMKEALQMLWDFINPGQKKQALKNPALRAALVRYGIYKEE